MKKWVGRIAIRLALVFAGFVVLFTVLAATGNQSLQREVGRWREQGLIGPADVADPDAADDAAHLRRWHHAASRLQQDETIVSALVDSSDDEAPSDAGGDRPSWDALQVTIEAVHAAAAEAGPLIAGETGDPFQWSEQLRDRLFEARRFVALLEAEARHHAMIGDEDAAVAAIAAGLAISDRVGAHGVLIAQLVRVAIADRMVTLIEALYAGQGVPPTALRDRLAGIDLRAELAETFRQEGLYALRIVSDTDPLTSRVSWSTRGWWYHDTAYLLQRYRTAIEQLDAGQTTMHALPLDGPHPWWTRNARIVLPAVHASLGPRLALHTRLAMVRVAIDLRQHRAEHGEYPPTLDDVDVPAVEAGLDEPLVYEPDDAGFTLRSSPQLEGEPLEWRWR